MLILWVQLVNSCVVAVLVTDLLAALGCERGFNQIQNLTPTPLLSKERGEFYATSEAG
jgi:hypothetical protein